MWVAEITKHMPDEPTGRNYHLLSPTHNVFMFLLQWYDLDAPEQASFPMKYKDNLTPFQKLLLIRCFRLDRVYRAVSDYVTLTMGEK